MQRKLSNTSGLTPEEVVTLPIYGSFRNSWRNRYVTVRHHPTEPTAVITVGVSYDGAEVFICDEPYASYAHRIETPDWSEYK
jgi:hypothetical protein